MKFGNALRVLCMLLVCSLLLTSCTLFRRNKNSPQEDSVENTENTEDTTEEDEKDPSSEDSETKPVVPDPTPEELIADMMPYDFNKAIITVAVPEDCAMFDQGTDSNAVLAEVLEAIEKKYNTTVLFTEFDKEQMYEGTEEMVTLGTSVLYFADILVLSATEYARYRNAGLLERMETIPFLKPNDDCFDAKLGQLFCDEGGTFGVVGYGSQIFKNQITVFINPSLLKEAGISFDGYPMVKNGSWDVAALESLLQEYTQKTGKSALASVLSEEINENLYAMLEGQEGAPELTEPYAFGQSGRDEFMLGKVPVLIGVLADVERMYLALDDYRMLPIPYMENGEYETFYDMESVYVFCVPKGNIKTDYTGIFINAYHTASEYLPYSYFQQFLLEKYVRDEGTLRVIALVGKTAKYLPEKEIETEE